MNSIQWPISMTATTDGGALELHGPYDHGNLLQVLQYTVPVIKRCNTVSLIDADGQEIYRFWVDTEAMALSHWYHPEYAAALNWLLTAEAFDRLMMAAHLRERPEVSPSTQ